MKIVYSAVVVAVLISGITSFPNRRRKRWSINTLEHVAAPGFEPISLYDRQRDSMLEKYSDSSVGLTVIKDPSPQIKACFITDFDPEWFLTTEDKMDIIASQEPQVIRTLMDLAELIERAGPSVAGLCRKLHIYWLTFDLTFPMTKVSSFRQQEQPIHPSEVMKSPPSEEKKPPSLTDKEEPVSEMKTPPPMIKMPSHIYPDFKAPEKLQAVHQMKTPPPLSKKPPSENLKMFKFPLKTRKSTVRQIKTPPPLIRMPPAFKSPLNDKLAPVHQMKTPPPLSRYLVSKHKKIPPPFRGNPESPEAPVHQMKTPPPLSQYLIHKHEMIPPPYRGKHESPDAPPLFPLLDK